MPETGKAESENSGDESERRHDLRSAIIGGVAAAVIRFTGMPSSASQAPSRHGDSWILCFPPFDSRRLHVAGGATILALMLTLIRFSSSNELEFRRQNARDQ